MAGEGGGKKEGERDGSEGEAWEKGGGGEGDQLLHLVIVIVKQIFFSIL